MLSESNVSGWRGEPQGSVQLPWGYYSGILPCPLNIVNEASNLHEYSDGSLVPSSSCNMDKWVRVSSATILAKLRRLQATSNIAFRIKPSTSFYSGPQISGASTCWQSTLEGNKILSYRVLFWIVNHPKKHFFLDSRKEMSPGLRLPWAVRMSKINASGLFLMCGKNTDICWACCARGIHVYAMVCSGYQVIDMNKVFLSKSRPRSKKFECHSCTQQSRLFKQPHLLPCRSGAEISLCAHLLPCRSGNLFVSSPSSLLLKSLCVLTFFLVGDEQQTLLFKNQRLGGYSSKALHQQVLFPNKFLCDFSSFCFRA